MALRKTYRKGKTGGMCSWCKGSKKHRSPKRKASRKGKRSGSVKRRKRRRASRRRR